MVMMDISVIAQGVTVKPLLHGDIVVHLQDVDLNDIVDKMSKKEVDVILAAIGDQQVKQWLKDIEEEELDNE